MWLVEVVAGAFALLLGVWFFLIFIDVLDRWTSRITPEQAKKQSQEMNRRWLKEQQQQHGSTAGKP